MVVVRQLSHM